MKNRENLFFRQLFDRETSTYTYIVGDRVLRDAVIIDPVKSQVDRDLNLIQELDFDIHYILDTHVHADHITGAEILRDKLDAHYVLGKGSHLKCADILVEDGDLLKVGNFQVEVLSTPGHTDSCTSYLIENMVFTGDALLVRGCGRTDFQQGSSETLFHSIRKKLFQLPNETLVYPAHDYKGFTNTTIIEEKTWNPRVSLQKSKEDFKSIMEDLNLAPPKNLKHALMANVLCGRETLKKPIQTKSG